VTTVRLLGISGSLRRGSHNTALLLTAADTLSPPARLERYDRLALLPAYDADADVAPAPVEVALLREAIGAADALLIATPEYNGSIPGALKNAVDWASRPFPASVLRDKPAAVVGASTGMFGALWAQAELRKVLRIAGARVLDRELAVAYAQDGIDQHARGQLADLVAELVRGCIITPDGQRGRAAAASGRVPG
jgi:chromate reductase, NAD(P)H dehydrogenase (quinone)